MNRIAAILLAAAVPALAYVPDPIDGPQFHRTDFAKIQFLANQNIAPGLTRADGTTVWITPDSAPMDALNAAISTWNAVPTSAARFAPLQTTALSYNKTDGNNVIVFADDPNTQSLVNGALAFTVVVYPLSDPSIILDTDIYFSPSVQFSTTQAAGTFDIQAVATHELGHALGSNHTNILAATMYYATTAQDIHTRNLSADDIAFVSSLYPPAGGNGYGIISGVATVSGTPLLGGAITALDPDTGITIGGFSSVSDGSFSLQAPPGRYFVYVEPAVNLVLYQSNPAVDQSTIVFTAFESAFAGGNNQPTLTEVQAGATATVNLNAASGTTPIKAPFAGVAIAGQIGDFHGSLTRGGISISSGQSVDLVLTDPLPGTLAESNLQILGPATLRPGSLRRDAINLTDGTPIYRFTLDIPPLASTGLATLVIKNGSDILTRSGMLILTRPQSVNAGSFQGGPVAPGEILSFFAPQLGPTGPVNNAGFDDNGLLPVTLGGLVVSFDSTRAPLFYVSNTQVNLQVPYEIAGQATTLMTVIYNGSTVATSTLSVAPSAPGIFLVTNANGSVNGPLAPSSGGDTLVIYGTGVGVTSGLLHTGAASPSNAVIPASVSIAGRAVTPAFSGLAPGLVGLAQINVTIPAGIPPGDSIPVQFSLNGASSQAVNISVR